MRHVNSILFLSAAPEKLAFHLRKFCQHLQKENIKVSPCLLYTYTYHKTDLSREEIGYTKDQNSCERDCKLGQISRQACGLHITTYL